jgi:hypothetical protein
LTTNRIREEEAMLDLTHIHPHLRSGPSPGRRLLALALSALLVLGSLSPGIAAARENDSEGEGTGGPTVELPVPPDFDPGGEETGLEESPAPGEGEEEVGAVESEAEVGIELPSAQEGAPAAVEPPAEPAAPQPAPALVPEPAAPAYEPAQQPTETVAESEPVVNETIAAPPPAKVSAGDRDRPESAVQPEAPAPVEPEQQEAPSSPQPVEVPPADTARSLAGKESYVVRPGDCLSHIAAALLSSGADTAAIEGEVARLWNLNADRIGTGDPNLIYAGTTLRLR